MTSVVQRARPGSVWAAPAGIVFLVFGILPIFGVLFLSLTSWNGLGTPRWTGLDNWRAMGSDAELVPGIRSTLLLTTLSWAVQTPIALLIGVWAAGPQRSRAVVSAIFFLPLLLSATAIALTWVALLDPNFGAAAVLGPHVGIPDGNIIGNPRLALYAVVFVLTWQFVPLHTLIYQSAVRQIPDVLYEAAAIDGAGRMRQFFTITLPQLRNTIVASSILIIVGSLTYFESILLLTGGGPGTATRVLPLHMFIEGFRGFDMGYASALATLLVLIGTTLSILIVRTTGYHRMTSEREGL